MTNTIWSASFAVCCTLLTTLTWADDVSVFAGRSLDGWTTLDGEPVSRGWHAADGVIYLDRLSERAGHIITADEFGDFDLSFEFKIAPGGNSGLKYRVRRFGGSTLGCEYQIIDAEGTGRVRPTKNWTGSLYDVYEPDASQFSLKPSGEFNTARIVVHNDRIQHWLNGRLIVSATVGDAEWDRRIAESKFNDVEGFGRNQLGRIMLTDHGSEVWYRNFRIQRLDSVTEQLVVGRSHARDEYAPLQAGYQRSSRCFRPFRRLWRRRR